MLSGRTQRRDLSCHRLFIPQVAIEPTTAVRTVTRCATAARRQSQFLSSYYKRFICFYFFSQQKRRTRNDGRNKENIINEAAVSSKEEKEDTEETKIKQDELKKDLCYEIKHSDIMGR